MIVSTFPLHTVFCTSPHFLWVLAGGGDISCFKDFAVLISHFGCEYTYVILCCVKYFALTCATIH